MRDQRWEALLRRHDFVTEMPAAACDADEYYDAEPGVTGQSVSTWVAFLDDVAGFDREFCGMGEHRSGVRRGVDLLMRWPTKATVPPRTDTTSTAGLGGVFQRARRLCRAVVVGRDRVLGCARSRSAAFVPLAGRGDPEPAAHPLPSSAPALVSNRAMAEAFPKSATEDNVLLVLLTNEKGLAPLDGQVYRTLVDRLHRDNQDVVMLQDFVGTLALRETLSSQDGKAWIPPVGLAGDLASPEANAAYTRVVDIVRNTVAGTTLTANLTGTAATVADVIDVSVRDRVRIEAAILTLLLIILLIIYRNPITMLLPLITIGVSLAIAQTVLAGVSLLGWPGIALERPVASTGGVITAAGLIFAASMFGLLFASITTNVQIGFVVGIGILLDTFLVRTVTVPAMAVLVGRANWWPSRWRPRQRPAPRAKPAGHRPVGDAESTMQAVRRL